MLVGSPATYTGVVLHVVDALGASANLALAAIVITSGSSVVAPTITSQPASASVVAPNTATFTVSATTGGGTLSYQWQRDTGGGFSNVSGANSNNYTTPATTTGDTGSSYRCVVTNSAGSVTSNAATLTVTSGVVAPTITSQPAAATVTEPATATFTVAATTGGGTLTYQWQRNGTNIGGATAASYTTPATAVTGGAANNGDAYRCVVTNPAGSVTSNAATLTVSAAAVAPGAVTGVTPGTATSSTQPLTWTAPTTGTTPITYTVGYRLGSSTGAYTTFATGVTGTASTVTGLAASTAYDYQITPVNSAGSGTPGLLNDAVTAAPPPDTRPAFSYGIANPSGTTATFDTIFAARVPMDVTGASGGQIGAGGAPAGGKAGSFTTFQSPSPSATDYTWIFIPSGADSSGLVVNDGAGTGGFSGATYAGINPDGDPASPITVRHTYTNAASGTTWHVYRSNGKAATFAGRYTTS